MSTSDNKKDLSEEKWKKLKDFSDAITSDKEEAIDKLLEDDEFVIVFSWRNIAYLMTFLYFVVVIESIISKKHANSYNQPSRRVCQKCGV